MSAIAQGSSKSQPQLAQVHCGPRVQTLFVTPFSCPPLLLIHAALTFILALSWSPVLALCPQLNGVMALGTFGCGQFGRSMRMTLAYSLFPMSWLQTMLLSHINKWSLKEPTSLLPSTASRKPQK
jgi:hypothetical protein